MHIAKSTTFMGLSQSQIYLDFHSETTETVKTSYSIRRMHSSDRSVSTTFSSRIGLIYQYNKHVDRRHIPAGSCPFPDMPQPKRAQRRVGEFCCSYGMTSMGLYLTTSVVILCFLLISTY